jgi:eukaryotic-like serine/threonine-protein kinase
LTDLGVLIANRYRVEATIGEGGMGRVLRVFDTRSERMLALKQLLAPKNDELRLRMTALFQQEFHVLSHIAHPHVVRVFDYGVEGLDPYYTMEILEGQDLREVSPLPWHRVAEILLQLCSALSVVHARRFVHCDLTPRNVVLMADGNAKLIDFGAMAPVGQRRSPIGTPAYMAPEMVRGLAIDARADLFALGALAYHALTQRHAFPAASVTELEHVWTGAPPAPSNFAPDVPATLDALVISLLSLDAQARPINVAEVSATRR